MSERLKLNVYCPQEPDPSHAAILGAGKLISDPQLLNEILIS